MNFGLIGDGYIAKYHKQVINDLGGKLIKIYDPKMEDESEKRAFERYTSSWFQNLDCVVICSPSNIHRNQTILALRNNVPKIIVEKPAVLPWEPIIDDNRINVVLQLRWIKELDKFNPSKITCKAIRNEDYFKTWKGDPWNTGGVMFNIFIHYIDLAVKYRCKFFGYLSKDGDKQIKTIENQISKIDINEIDMVEVYKNMYNDIINYNNGIKPNHIFKLHWILNRLNIQYGMSTDLFDKQIEIDFKTLGV